MPLFGKGLEKTSYEVLKRMGSIIEFPTFYDHMSGKDNLQLHCEYMGYYNKGSVEEALGMLGLSDAADKPAQLFFRNEAAFGDCPCHIVQARVSYP